MKIHTMMPSSLKPFWKNELRESERLFLENNLSQSWWHLERAHIIGQAYPIEHSVVHWKMLLFGLKTKNIREVIGQLPRLLVGGVKSFVGEIPVGNTGGANVPPLQPMTIPEDLQRILNQNSK